MSSVDHDVKQEIENLGSLKPDGRNVNTVVNDTKENSFNRENDQNDNQNENCPKKMSVLSYVMSELTRGYLLERDKDKFTERRQRVYTFMRTPRELEKFLIYGVLQCVDTFLFIFTFLPLRIVLALLKIVTHPCGMLLTRSQKILEPAQICDILKGIILIVCLVIVNHIDTSMMYHLVRGQAVIKLYVFFNMLEMADRLFSSFGQDILDALFWTATEPRGRKRDHLGTIPHLILAIIYVVIHTLLILFQATVLNVAFNSHNKALLIVMMSNNFVEIKGSMFRKMDQNLLYQISCSDSKERFHYMILLSVVFIRNMAEFSWDPDQVWVIIPDAVLVLVAEVLVDWIKHAFILKFNETKADVYGTFSLKLAKDMISNRQSRAFIDYSDQVSRRMTLTPLPLACLILRICTKSFRISGTMGTLIIVMLYLCLLTLKIIINILLMGRAHDLLTQEKAKMKANEEELLRSHVRQKGLSRSQSDCSDHRPDSNTIKREFQNMRKTQSVSFSSSMLSHDNSVDYKNTDINHLDKGDVMSNNTSPVLEQVPSFKKESKFTHLRFRKISEAEDVPRTYEDSNGPDLYNDRNPSPFKTESSV